MVVAFWGMTAIWAQDSTPWYMGTWNRHQPNPKAKDMPLVQIDVRGEKRCVSKFGRSENI